MAVTQSRAILVRHMFYKLDTASSWIYIKPSLVTSRYLTLCTEAGSLDDQPELNL